MVSEAFQTAASSEHPLCSAPRGNIAGQAEALPAPLSTRQAIYAELRAQVDRDDWALTLEPRLTRKERISFGIMMVAAALVGFALAVQI